MQRVLWDWSCYRPGDYSRITLRLMPPRRAIPGRVLVADSISCYTARDLSTSWGGASIEQHVLLDSHFDGRCSFLRLAFYMLTYALIQ